MYRSTKILKIFQNSEFVVKVSRNSYYVGGLFPRWEYVRCIDDSFSQRAGSLKKSQNQDVKIKFREAHEVRESRERSEWHRVWSGTVTTKTTKATKAR